MDMLIVLLLVTVNSYVLSPFAPHATSQQLASPVATVTQSVAIIPNALQFAQMRIVKLAQYPVFALHAISAIN